MNRRRFLGLSAAALSATVLVGCQPVSSPTPTAAGASNVGAATLGLTYIPNVQFAPAYVAEDKGAFAGVKVTLRHHGEQEGLFTALTQGQEQFVIAGGDEMLQARAQGMDLVAVASYYGKHPVRVIARNDAGIVGLASLKGKKIGIPGRYGESWFGLLVALETAGLKETDVQIQEIGYTATAAMATKKVDAVIGFTNNDTVQLKAAKVDVTELELAPDVPLVGASLITTGEIARTKPELVKAVRDGVVQGMKTSAEDHNAALESTKKRVPTLSAPAQMDAAKATWSATAPLLASASGRIDGQLTPATWDAMSTFMLKHELITKPVPAREAVATVK